MMKMKLADIVIDEALYPRQHVIEFNVSRMREALKAGAKFPPLTVEAGTHRLVDGRHRYESYVAEGVGAAQVIEKAYATEADLFAAAVRQNIGHGQALDHYSVRSAVAKLMEYGYDRDQIGETVRMTSARVDEIIKGFAASEGGQAVALKGGLAHLGGSTLTDGQIKAIKRYGGGQATFYARQLLTLIEKDLWPRESEGFATAMDKLITEWTRARKRRAA